MISDGANKWKLGPHYETELLNFKGVLLAKFSAAAAAF
jgi:hypothetical protein